MAPSDENLVQLTRVLRASPRRGLRRLDRARLLERWWTGVGGWVDAKADVDLRVGGNYHLSMRDERGDLHSIAGFYTEVAPSERLGFTWTWESDPSVMRGSEGSLVDLVFREAPAGSQLTLTHGGLGSTVVRDLHEGGRNALLTRLFALVS